MISKKQYSKYLYFFFLKKKLEEANRYKLKITELLSSSCVTWVKNKKKKEIKARLINSLPQTVCCATELDEIKKTDGADREFISR